jgi:hypothetical protein
VRERERECERVVVLTQEMHLLALVVQLGTHFGAFWSLFSDIDKLHIEIDENKREMTALLYEFLEADPVSHVPMVTRREDQIIRLMDYFVCLRATDRDITYNNLAIPSFYRVLSILTQYDDALMARFSMHTNFDWAVQNIYWSTDYLPSM